MSFKINLGQWKTYEVSLIEDAKQAWKFASVWFLLLLGVLPQIWDGAVSSGLLNSPLVPAKLQFLTGTISALGVFFRLFKQQLKTINDEAAAKVKADAAAAATASTNVVPLTSSVPSSALAAANAASSGVLVSTSTPPEPTNSPPAA